jgi:Protein of unknown function (DUF2846)
MPLRTAFLAATTAWLLAGCATPTAKELVGAAIGRPYQPTAEDRAKLPADSNFKLQPPASGKAVVYIYRNSQFYAGGVNYQVFIDDRLSGAMGNGQYVRLEMASGEYDLRTQRPQYVSTTAPAADDLNNIQAVPKLNRRLRLQPDETFILRLNLGERQVGLNRQEIFNLEAVGPEEAVFDMSRLKQAEK